MSRFEAIRPSLLLRLRRENRPRDVHASAPSERNPAIETAKLVAAALALVPSVLAVSYAHDASACGMSIRMEPTLRKPTPVQQIAGAEKALENGQNAVAAKAVLATFPRVRTATAGANPLEARALRVFALAVVRSNGAVNDKTAGFASPAGWTPAANLEWSVQSIREIDAKRPNDPTVQADLGRGAEQASSRAEGGARDLQKLAERDLMGSPHAYAALAMLRTSKGDLAGAEARRSAARRCRRRPASASLRGRSSSRRPPRRLDALRAFGGQDIDAFACGLFARSDGLRLGLEPEQRDGRIGRCIERRSGTKP